MLKSLNIKIPVNIALKMEERGQLNPSYVSGLIQDHLTDNKGLDKQIIGLSHNYTFKIDSNLHREVKLRAIEVELPMNELVGRLIQQHYGIGE